MTQVVYGVVSGGIFLSDRMRRRLASPVPDGVYQMDASADDFESTIAPADISRAAKVFRASRNVLVVRGVSFRDGMIPENPVRFPKLPLKVAGATYGPFEEVEAASVRGGSFQFLQTVSTQKAYPLMEIKSRFEAGDLSIKGVKEVSPEMRVMHSLMVAEKVREAQEAEKAKREAERAKPVNAIRSMMEESGARVLDVRETNLGYEVDWEFDDYVLSTVLDKQFRVQEAGFCVSGHDRTQTVRSVVNVIRDYVRDGDAVHVMRSPGDPRRRGH